MAKKAQTTKSNKLKSSQKLSSNSSPIPRRLKRPQYKHFRLHKKIKPYQPPLISSYKILGKTWATLKSRKRTYLVMLLVYVFLTIVFVKGFSQSLNINNLKNQLSDVYSGASGAALSGIALMSLLVGSGGSSNSGDGSGVYQGFFLVAMVLATVWTLRQKDNIKITSKEAYYSSMYPLIPFLLVMSVVGLQLIPVGIAGWIESTVIQTGIAASPLEQVAWWLLIILLLVLSLYMVLSSMFGLIIVTLPGVLPIRALKSARDLVIHRRLMVLRKLILLPVVLLLVSFAIMFPFLVWIPQIAEWVFIFVAAGGWMFTVVYIYTLYKELLNER